ncbi:MAG: flagellar basal body rod protein FlgC [Planctomycetes bacterium]|nr:flagellar basal body rod protein FlgC [Planctomycetota bacterium]
MSGISHLFSGMRASSSGLAAERIRLDVIAKNLANAETTRTPEGTPYRRQEVWFEPLLQRAENGAVEVRGVKVGGVQSDFATAMERILSPGHPDADADGYVTMPNVNTTHEMVDLISASRAYEANLSAQESFVAMAERALRLAQ